MQEYTHDSEYIVQLDMDYEDAIDYIRYELYQQLGGVSPQVIYNGIQLEQL